MIDPHSNSVRFKHPPFTIIHKLISKLSSLSINRDRHMMTRMNLVLLTLASFVTAHAFLGINDEKGNSIVDGSSELFTIKRKLLREEDRAGLVEFAATGLGPDPSSQSFTSRKKALAFVLRLESKLYLLDRDHFNQPVEVNDFSGGYARRFQKIPEAIIHRFLSKTIQEFCDYNAIPDREVVMLQLQESEIDDLSKRSSSLTGQGIHTDGHYKAGIVVVKRSNVAGGATVFHSKLNGSEPLHSTVLDEGDATFFQDNQIYHVRDFIHFTRLVPPF